MTCKQVFYGLVCLLLGVAAQAAGPVLNAVEKLESKSHFKVSYEFSNEIDRNDVSFQFRNSTVQVNVKGAEISLDKRFDKIADPMVKNLYSFKPSRDSLALRINYLPSFLADDFAKRVDFEIKGKKLIVSVADGRAIKMGTLDNILEKPSNLNAAKIEDKFKYLQLKLSDEELQDSASSPAASKPRVMNAENFEQELAGSLRFDKSDSIKDEIPEFKAPSKRKQGPIKVRRVRGVSSAEKDKVLIREDVSLDQDTKKELKESEIPAFSSPIKADTIKNDTPVNGLMTGLFIVLALLGVSFLALNRYGRKKIKDTKHQTINVLTQHHLGPKKSLAIIRVAGESILIGVTDQNINLIKSLTLMDDELPSNTSQSFDKSLNSASVNEQIGMGMGFQDDDEEDDFSVRGLKEMVKSRLTGMKEL